MLLTAGPSVPLAAKALPNVVMIMADDLGWSEIAAYRRYQGLHDPIPTPNLDRLVAEGMMFTDAHSPASLCAPTRFSMMTGSYPYRNTMRWGTWGFTNPSAFTRNRKHVTIGEVMQAAGYRTAFLGKMHFGGGVEDFDNAMPAFPTTYGFDYVFSTHDGIQAPPYLYFENDRFVKIDPLDPLNPSAPGTNADTVVLQPGLYEGINGTGKVNETARVTTSDPLWNSSQNGIINSRKAADFIGDHMANHPEQPFMMYYCSPQVHVPHTPPIDFEPDNLGQPGDPANKPVAGFTGGDELADVVYELDLQVGWIIARLEDPDGDGDTADSILADTLVMFTSDNGGLGSERGFIGYDSTGTLKGFKSMIEEGGHRVPFVARWGDGTPHGSYIRPGSVSDQLICGMDWVGAMYALTEQNMQPDQAVDCVNILPILLGERGEDNPVREFLFHQSQDSKKKAFPYGIRHGDFVMFMDGDHVPGELYNLREDLSQTVNLLESEPSQAIHDRRDAMLALYLAHDDPDDPRTTPVITTISAGNVLSEDFESVGVTDNIVGAPYPAGTWHLQDATGSKPHWTRDDQDEGQSVQIGDFNDDPDQEMRIGWGYDEVVVLYSTTHPIDASRNYFLSGDWEMANTLDNSLGFIAGFAEFRADDGSLVQRLTGDDKVFGPRADAVIGQTGSFQIILTAEALQAADVTEGNLIGIFLHHDDDGVLYSDNAGFGENRNDVYLIDNVELGVNGGTPFEKWAHANGVVGKDADPDGDGVCNLLEFAFGGDPMSFQSRGFQPVLEMSPSGLRASFPKRRNVPLEYSYESRLDLLAGQWNTSEETPESSEGAFTALFGVESVTFPAPDGRVFLRLIVSD
jgi:arylsulfatase A-like enzyme